MTVSSEEHEQTKSKRVCGACLTHLLPHSLTPADTASHSLRISNALTPTIIEPQLGRYSCLPMHSFVSMTLFNLYLKQVMCWLCI